LGVPAAANPLPARPAVGATPNRTTPLQPRAREPSCSLHAPRIGVTSCHAVSFLRERPRGTPQHDEHARRVGASGIGHRDDGASSRRQAILVLPATATATATRRMRCDDGGRRSVPDQRQESARHRVDDALAWLHAARGRAPRRGAQRPAGVRTNVASRAVRSAHAGALHVTGRPALRTPTSGQKNGRRPHRCLQSGRKKTSRRP
jgi:hypothetical protein